MRPKFQDDIPINPFDFWTGADFKLKVLKKDGYWNYDSSEFESPSEFLDGNDDELEEIYRQLHNLSEFVNPENFKSYEELQSRLDKVLGNVSQASSKKLDPELQEELDEEYEEVTSKKSSKVISREDDDEDDEDADDALSYFERLASM